MESLLGADGFHADHDEHRYEGNDALVGNDHHCFFTPCGLLLPCGLGTKGGCLLLHNPQTGDGDIGGEFSRVVSVWELPALELHSAETTICVFEATHARAQKLVVLIHTHKEERFSTKIHAHELYYEVLGTGAEKTNRGVRQNAHLWGRRNRGGGQTKTSIVGPFAHSTTLGRKNVEVHACVLWGRTSRSQQLVQYSQHDQR